MKLGDKLPVAPLDEMRVARIERGIISETATLAAPQPQARSYRLPMLAVLAVAGVLLVLLLNSGDTHRATALATPTQVVTGPGQSSELVLGDAKISVGENTQVAVERFADGRTILHLASGRVDCQVQPRPQRPTFQVVSGDVTVTVVGTAFQVTRNQLVEVEVVRGIVAVSTSHEKQRLLAGDSWQGSPLATGTLAMLETQEKTEPALESTGSKVQESTRNKAQEKIENASKAEEPIKGAEPQAQQRSWAGPRRGTAKKPKATIKLSEVLLSAKPLKPIYKRSYSPALAALKPLSARSPSKAVAQLASFSARSTGAQASFALYTRAYLLFFKLHNHAEVIKSAKQYARRFPKGLEAEDMLWLRVRASCTDNQFSTCRAAAHTYLRRYPRGIFKGLASRIIRTANNK